MGSDCWCYSYLTRVIIQTEIFEVHQRIFVVSSVSYLGVRCLLLVNLIYPFDSWNSCLLFIISFIVSLVCLVICICRALRNTFFDFRHRLPTSDIDFRHRLPTLSTPTQSDTFWRYRKKNRFSKVKLLNVDLKEAKSWKKNQFSRAKLQKKSVFLERYLKTK